MDLYSSVGLASRMYLEEAEFTDLMLKGIYRSFRHTHEFKFFDGRTCVTDTVEFTFGLGKTIDRLIGLPTLRRTFEERHRLLKEWADRWTD